jgi:hypothetical protein
MIIGIVGVVAFTRWRVMEIDTLRCTPAMWLQVQLSIWRGERVEAEMGKVETLPVREQALRLLRLLEKCDRSLSDEAKNILDQLDGRWLSVGDLVILGKQLAEKGDWLARLAADRFAEMAEEGALSEDVRAGAFKIFANILPSCFERDGDTRAVGRALLILGGEQGQQLLEAQLDRRSPGFGALLEVLERSKHPTSPALVERLLREDEEARRGEGRTPSARTVSLLALLAKTRPEIAEPRLLAVLALPDHPATSAAEVLFDLYNLPHPRGSLMDWGDENGLASLSEDEATTYLADRFGYYAGHQLAHTLLEEMGGELPRMRDAVRKVNAPVGAQLLDKIIAVLPAGGLPKDNQARLKYLRNEGNELETTVFRLMDAHEYAGEDFVLLAWRYEVENRNGFRKLPSK